MEEKSLAIYSRKSRFTGKGESIENQIELCREYIRQHISNEAAEKAVVYEDEGFSGRSLKRPSFRLMMDAVQAKRHCAVIVYRLDRISRNISDFTRLIEELSRLRVDFISIREQFDTSQPMGRAMMYIASVFSQLERETIAERIRDNMRELAKTGRWLGGITPTGYASEAVNRVTIDGKTKKMCILKLLPEEAENVKTIFQIFTETSSLTKTEAELMQRRIHSKNDKYHTRFSIKAILQNPVYAMADASVFDYFTANGVEIYSCKREFDGVHGVMAYNRTDQEKGRATVYLPMDQWIVAVGRHPGLIPGYAWVRVQEALAKNQTKAFRRPRSNEALLTGLLFCACGNRMYPKTSSRKRADGKVSFAYVCKLKERSQKSLCASKNAPGNTLDDRIIEQMTSLPVDQSAFLARLSASRSELTGNQPEYEQQQKALRQEKAALEKKINGLLDSLGEMDNSPSRSLIVQRLEAWNQECQCIEASIQEAEGIVARNQMTAKELAAWSEKMNDPEQIIRDMSLEQRRAALKALIQFVIWDGVVARVFFYGFEPEDEEAKTLLCEDSK